MRADGVCGQVLSCLEDPEGQRWLSTPCAPPGWRGIESECPLSSYCADDGELQVDAGACDLDLTVSNCEACSTQVHRISAVSDACACEPHEACISVPDGWPSADGFTLFYSQERDQVYALYEDPRPEGLVQCEELEHPPPACACDPTICL